MEFRQREVKRPKQFKTRTVENKAPAANNKFKRTYLIVSIRCEVFDIGDINRVELQSPIAIPMNRSYNQEYGIREYKYDVSIPRSGMEDVKEYIEKISNHWRTGLSTIGNGDLVKKVKFKIEHE